MVSIVGFNCPKCGQGTLAYSNKGRGAYCTACGHELSYGELFDAEWPEGDPIDNEMMKQEHQKQSDSDKLKIAAAFGPVVENMTRRELEKRYTDHPGDRLIIATEPGGLTAAQVNELIEWLQREKHNHTYYYFLVTLDKTIDKINQLRGNNGL